MNEQDAWDYAKQHYNDIKAHNLKLITLLEQQSEYIKKLKELFERSTLAHINTLQVIKTN